MRSARRAGSRRPRNTSVTSVTSVPSVWPAALAVFIIALVLRLIHLWLLTRGPFFDLLIGDARAYAQWAGRIAAGDWVGDGVFYQAPLYPYLLAIYMGIAGSGLTAIHALHVLLGSAGCAVLTVAGVRLFGRPAGLAAGLLQACYGPAIFFDGLTEKTSLDLLLFALLLLSIAMLIAEVRPLRALGAGLLVGALALNREHALILAPILCLWIAWRTTRVQPALIFVLGLLVALAPAMAHNASVGGGLVLTTSQSGTNFYIGNHAGAGGTYEPLRPGRGNAADERDDATRLAQQAVGRSLQPSEVSAYWWTQGLNWIRTHPVEWLGLTGKKLLLVWNAGEVTDTEDIDSHATWSPVLYGSTLLLHFGVLAPLGLFGVWLTRARWRELWVLYAIGGAYAFSVALFYVLARYRYPLVPLLTLFAGTALASVPAWWRAATPRSRLSTLAAIAALAVVCNWPLLSRSDLQAVTFYNLGVEWQAQGRAPEAIDEYRQALSQAPRFAPAHANLGILLAATGQGGEARAHLDEALRLDPTLIEAQVNLGIVMASAGDERQAIGVLRHAAQQEPDNASAHYNLGLVLANTNDLIAARQEFEKTVTLDPGNAAAHNNLGIALAATGQIYAGIAQFRAALQIQPNYPEAQANLTRALSQTTTMR